MREIKFRAWDKKVNRMRIDALSKNLKKQENKP